MKKKRWWRHGHMTKFCLWASRLKHFSQLEDVLHPKLHYSIFIYFLLQMNLSFWFSCLIWYKNWTTYINLKPFLIGWSISFINLCLPIAYVRFLFAGGKVLNIRARIYFLFVCCHLLYDCANGANVCKRIICSRRANKNLNSPYWCSYCTQAHENHDANTR